MVMIRVVAGIVLCVGLAGAAVLARSGEADICRPGYARSERLPPERYYPIAEEAYRRAGVPWEARHAYRVDHIVPLCLGGSWDQDNLQIQTTEAAAAKDRLEVAACRAYCAGEVSLEAARARFHRER